MDKKAFVITVVVGLLLVGSGVLFYSNSNSAKKQPEPITVKKETNQAITKKEDVAMSSQGSYITLADYSKNPTKYAESNKVYFFHASWCPICQSIDKEITADTSKIPQGITLIKTDFDSATDLRKKYGVTTQYTFVQIDSSGNEKFQWSAASLSDALAGIKL